MSDGANLKSISLKLLSQENRLQFLLARVACRKRDLCGEELERELKRWGGIYGCNAERVSSL